MKQLQNSEKLLSRQVDYNDDKAIGTEGGEADGERERRSRSLRGGEAGVLQSCSRVWDGMLGRGRGSPWVRRAFRLCERSWDGSALWCCHLLGAQDVAGGKKKKSTGKRKGKQWRKSLRVKWA